MNLDELKGMLEEVKRVCDEVDNETEMIKREKENRMKMAYSEFRSEMAKRCDMMELVEMYEFSFPMGITIRGYSKRPLSIHMYSFSDGEVSLCDPVRNSQWCVTKSTMEIVLKWWNENKDEFDKSFQKELLNASKEKIQRTLKRNEEAMK